MEAGSARCTPLPPKVRRVCRKTPGCCKLANVFGGRGEGVEMEGACSASLTYVACERKGLFALLGLTPSLSVLCVRVLGFCLVLVFDCRG